MRSKVASIFAALAGFMAITAVAAALAGAEPVSESSAVTPATTTTAVPSLAAPACANGLDDDGDGLVDTADPDCESPEDTTEVPPAAPAEATEAKEGEAVPAPVPAPAPETDSKGGVKQGAGIGAPETTGSAAGKGGPTRNDELAAPGGNSGGVTAPSANGGGDQALPEGSNGGSQFTEGGAPTTANPTTTIAPFGPAPIGVPNFVIDSFEIPPFLLPIYQACGTEYGIPWEVLASINKIESGFGTNLNVSSAGAVGWMQFLPSSWEAFGLDANGDGRKDPYNPVDAICAAAHYLKLAGGNKDLYQAIFAYNHADWYVQEVLLYARAYGRLPSDLVGSLTGLTEGARFPIAANARYADDIAARQALRSGEEIGSAAEVISSSPTPRGINIFSKEGAPVVAVNDGVVRKLGHSAKLGNFLVLEDTYGNRYTYAELGKLVRDHRLVVMPSGKKKRVPVESQDLRPRLRAYPSRAEDSKATDKLEAALAASGEGSIRVGSKVIAGTVLARVAADRPEADPRRLEAAGGDGDLPRQGQEPVLEPQRRRRPAALEGGAAETRPRRQGARNLRMRPRRRCRRQHRPPHPRRGRVPADEGLQADDHRTRVRPWLADHLRQRLRAQHRRCGRHRGHQRHPGYRPPGPRDDDRRADPRSPPAAGDDAPAPGDLARGPAGRNQLRDGRPLRPRPHRLPPDRRRPRSPVHGAAEAEPVAAADQPPRPDRKSGRAGQPLEIRGARPNERRPRRRRRRLSSHRPGAAARIAPWPSSSGSSSSTSPGRCRSLTAATSRDLPVAARRPSSFCSGSARRLPASAAAAAVARPRPTRSRRR